MTHIVLFSGGLQSSYVSWLISQTYSNTLLLFHDTKTEPTDNYRFRDEVARYIGSSITEQSDGRDIWELFHDMCFLGNNRVPICSRELKSRQGKLFYQSLNDDFIIYYGFGVNEWRRAQKVIARYPKLNIAFPLIEKRIHNDTIRNILVDEWQICLPEMYRYFNHANCIPCVRWGKQYWKQCYLHYPNAYQYAMEQEDIFGYTIMKNMSLREFIPHTHDDQLLIESIYLPCICAT